MPIFIVTETVTTTFNVTAADIPSAIAAYRASGQQVGQNGGVQAHAAPNPQPAAVRPSPAANPPAAAQTVSPEPASTAPAKAPGA